MRSHRMTRPLSRAVASGWHEATSSLSWNEEQRGASAHTELLGCILLAGGIHGGLPGPNNPHGVTGALTVCPTQLRYWAKYRSSFLVKQPSSWAGGRQRRSNPAFPSRAPATSGLVSAGK